MNNDLTIPGPESPFKLIEFCIDYFNSTHIVLVGSYYAQERTAFIDLSNNLWTDGPTLTRPRTYVACATVTHPNGTRYFIIAGGAGGDATATETEILSEDNPDSWMIGNELIIL